MKRRYREERIIGILKEREAGMPLQELIRKHGICVQTYYRWKSKYGGMEVNGHGGSGSWRTKTGG